MSLAWKLEGEEEDQHIPKEGVGLNEPWWQGGGRTRACLPSLVDSLLIDLEYLSVWISFRNNTSLKCCYLPLWHISSVLEMTSDSPLTMPAWAVREGRAISWMLMCFVPLHAPASQGGLSVIRELLKQRQTGTTILIPSPPNPTVLHSSFSSFKEKKKYKRKPDNSGKVETLKFFYCYICVYITLSWPAFHLLPAQRYLGRCIYCKSDSLPCFCFFFSPVGCSFC